MGKEADALPFVGPALSLGESIAAPTNREQQDMRQHQMNMHMYEKQKADAIQFWNMNNEYNSPAEQVKRLKEAGLNEALMYGGNGGGGGNASTPNLPTMEPMNYTKPTQSLGDLAGQYYNIKQQKLQTDLLSKSLTEKDAAIAILAEQLNGIKLDNQQKGFNFFRDKEYFPHQLSALQIGNEQGRANINNTKANTFYTLRKDEREAILQGYTIREKLDNLLNNAINRAKTREEINNLIETRKLMKQDQTLRDFEIRLNKAGLKGNDPALVRIAKTYWDSIKDGTATKKVLGKNRAMLGMTPYGTFINSIIK